MEVWRFQALEEFCKGSLIRLCFVSLRRKPVNDKRMCDRKRVTCWAGAWLNPDCV